MEKKNKITKKQLKKEMLHLQEQFLSDGNSGLISRNYFAANSDITQAQYSSVYGSFKSYREANLKKQMSRYDLDIKKSGRSKRTYFVTAAIANAPLDYAFNKSIEGYLDYNNAQLVVLPMRGVKSTEWTYHESVLNLKKHFSTEFSFNDNLVAVDFMLTPQQINPLTGLNRYGNDKRSIIIAHSKQQMATVPTSNTNLPHIVHSTGSITIPTYAKTRQGRISTKDHVTGGLIVEVQDKKIYHIRQVQADENGGFYDLDRYYINGKSKKSKSSNVIVLGDLHIGAEDPDAINSWKELIKLTKPKNIVLHDVMDCISINHHERKKITYLSDNNIPSLEVELNLVADTLYQWCKEFKKVTFIVVKSNHDSWLDDYIDNGAYCEPDQHHNHRFALGLAKHRLDGYNPLEMFIRGKYTFNNIIFLAADSDCKINGVQLAAHGAIGNNGARGSVRSMELSHGSSISGHTHSPSILRDTWVVGTSTKLKLKYNTGGGSSWMHSSCILYDNGNRQLINSINGNWKLN